MNNTSEFENSERLEYFRQYFGCYENLFTTPQVKELGRLLHTQNQEHRFEIYFGIACVILSVLNIVSNTCYIYGLIKTNSKLTCIQKLFVYLTLIDLLAGLVVLPMLAVGQFYGMSCPFMVTFIALNGFVYVNDASTTVIIAALRFHAIIRPFNEGRHRVVPLLLGIQTLYSLGFVTAWVWVFSYGATLVNIRKMSAPSTLFVFATSITTLVCIFMSLREIRKQELIADQTADRKVCLKKLLERV